MAHANIPVFIPHVGCPNACVFCNQRVISGCGGTDAADAILAMAERTIACACRTRTSGADTEIAFFGGSFTGIDRRLMEDLLALAQRYVDEGYASAIRLSTRPDYIVGEITRLLSRYAVRTVGLGVQSLSDAVLARSRRGHTAADAYFAIAQLRESGFSVVGQMMLGLPGSDAETERMTARRLCEAGVEGVRIYPVLVLAGTALAEQYASGEYTPLSLDEAVSRTADLLEIFAEAGIRVLRVGLQESETLGGAVLAGPHHPAFGELALSEVFCRRMEKAAEQFPAGEDLIISVPRGRLSAAIGQKKKNLERLFAKFRPKTIKVIEIDTIFGYNIRIEHQKSPQTVGERKEARDNCI